MYLIINCPSCGKIIMANTANKTRSCSHCGVKVHVQGAKVLARSRTSQDAVEIIQHLKAQRGKGEHPVTFKKFKI